ncbi:BA75_03690T0 [Komagataella pastoris]|uniref:BA75_03690T0 n=1 Tax=Komagataella pastoris TaxID=4922 RepID=A0A1B2JGN5_PICPA|nr:BA75_03690T0 [Komagataella pastoris]
MSTAAPIKEESQFAHLTLMNKDLPSNAKQAKSKVSAAPAKTSSRSAGGSGNNNAAPVKKRVRTGCLTCRKKHKKCDENRNPKCDFCTLKGLECVWPENNKKNIFVNNSMKDFLGKKPVEGADSLNLAMNLQQQQSSNAMGNQSLSSIGLESFGYGSGIKNEFNFQDLIGSNSGSSDPTFTVDADEAQKFDISSKNSRKRQKLGLLPVGNAASHLNGFNGISNGKSHSFSSPSGTNDDELSGLMFNSPSFNPLTVNDSTNNSNHNIGLSPMSCLFSTVQEASQKKHANSSRHFSYPSGPEDLWFNEFQKQALTANGENAVQQGDDASKDTTVIPKDESSNSSIFSSRSSAASSNSGDDVGRMGPFSKGPEIEFNYDSFLESLKAESPSSSKYNLPDTLKEYMTLSSSYLNTQHSDTLANGTNGNYASTVSNNLSLSLNSFSFSDKFSLSPPTITDAEKFSLMRNFIDNISPWFDTFDNTKQFGTKIPILAKKCSSLYYAILAISSRQRERIRKEHNEKTLQCYQYSLQQLIPTVQSSNNIEYIITCILLSVFHIMSSEPSTQRDIIASLAKYIQSCNINGFTSNDKLEKSIFWNYVNLDLATCTIGEESMVIPFSYWVKETTDYKTIQDVKPFFTKKTSTTTDDDLDDMYAIYILYISGRIINLLNCRDAKLNFEPKWEFLWNELNEWELNKPLTFQSIVQFKANDESQGGSTFPTVLFSNSRSCYSNQLYHMSYIILVQNKPRLYKIPFTTVSASMSSPSDNRAGASASSTPASDHHASGDHLSPRSIEPSVSTTLSPPPNANGGGNKFRSTLWHAKQICGISINNNHNSNLAAKVNSLQPLWHAGKLISSKSEHTQLLKLLNNLECATGWPMNWKGKELIDYWNVEE